MKKNNYHILGTFLLLLIVSMTSCGLGYGEMDTNTKKIVYIAPDGTDGIFGNGLIDHPYRTIQKAYSMVEANGTIFIKNGTYAHRYNSLGIYNKPVKIVGENREKTILDHMDITIANYTEIKNLTLTGPFRGASSIWIVSNQINNFNVVIDSCNFRDISHHAIDLSSNHSSCDIKNCIFSNSKTSSDLVQVRGDFVKISSCDFINNRCNGNSALCIKSHRFVVENCMFNKNSASGTGSHGGAISLGSYTTDPNGPVLGSIINCDFIGNKATYGGAIYYYSIGPDKVDVSIEYCLFKDNSATDGGAIYLNIPSTFDIFHGQPNTNIFTNNKAKHENNTFNINMLNTKHTKINV